MKTILKVVLVTMVAGLGSACTGTANVPPVSVDVGRNLPKIPGSYAAQIQTGGWALKSDSNSFTCSAWTFDTDLNTPYTNALQDALANNLESVTFVPETLSPDAIKDRGLDGQIVIYQGGASSDFGVATGFLSGRATGRVALDANIAVVTADGLSFQQTVRGEGTGGNDVFTCDVIGDALGTAAGGAIRELVEDAILYVREGLRSSREKAEEKAAKPSI